MLPKSKSAKAAGKAERRLVTGYAAHSPPFFKEGMIGACSDLGWLTRACKSKHHTNTNQKSINLHHHRNRTQMKKQLTIIFLLAFAITSHAQDDKTERKQEIRDNAAEKKVVSKLKVDYNLFRRQILTLPEYGEERKKIPALQKASKMTVKIVAYVDSVDDAGDDLKTLIGYISENVGDNATNIYEITYDRALKKITTVKPTGETSDIEQEDNGDVKKAAPKKAATKKTKGDDDDEDGEDDQPAKRKLTDED